MQKRKPDQVNCTDAKDGGALVTGFIGYSEVYRRAFSDADEARQTASELFRWEFDCPPQDDDCDLPR